MKKIIIVLFLFNTIQLSADCVWDAKDKTTYKVLKTGYGGKILFTGGYGSDFIIEIDGYVSSYIESVIILKDDFCNWDDNVIYIDEEVFDVKSVTKI